MNQHSVNHNQTNRFRPRIEALEDRTVPAVFVTRTGTTLAFAGNGNAEVLNINDNGLGVISFNGDIDPLSPTASPEAGIQTIVVRMGGGNDTVRYNLLGNLGFFQQRTLNVDLDVGNDLFQANLSGRNLLFRSSLNISVDGGVGNDVIGTLAFNTNLIRRSSLSVETTGGPFSSPSTDNDVILLSYSGRNDGRISSSARGGDGRDLIRTRISERPGSRGFVRARAFGDDDNDNLGVFLTSSFPTPPPSGFINGGAGRDRCFGTPNVFSINCP